MVFVNSGYNAAIHSRNLRTKWYGSITLKNGTVIPFDMSNIKDGSGELTMRCSSDSAIELGGGYASELRVGFKKLDIDRYLLYDAVIGLYAAYIMSIRYETWEDVGDFSFEQIKDYSWDSVEADIQYLVPMGLYIIKEAMRTVDCIKATAYDYMIKLDKDLPSSFSEANRTPYNWLELACSACGISLGMTKAEVRRLANGRRVLDFANVNTEVKTYRDLVIQLAMATGSVAVINRAGALVLKQYSMTVQDAIGADFRYSSEFSDYQSYYTGLYATYQDENVTEYFRNTTEAEDTGLVLDLGVNSFLQITTESKREAAAQAVIDALSEKKYVPFDVSMPFNPAYEPMDILRFYDNQTETEDIAPLTKIVFRVNDKMAIHCGGANPALNEVSTREDKAIERVSSDMYSGDLFWMVMDNAPDESAVIITAKNTPVKIGEALFYASKDKSMLNIAYTATFLLNITTLVRVKLYADDTLIYTTEENMWPNENRLTVTTGYELDGKESHRLSAFLEIDESTLDVGGGGVLMEKAISDSGIYIASDDGVYGYSQVKAVLSRQMGFYGGADKISPLGAECESLYDFDNLTFIGIAHEGELEWNVFESDSDISYLSFETESGDNHYTINTVVSSTDNNHMRFGSAADGRHVDIDGAKTDIDAFGNAITFTGIVGVTIQSRSVSNGIATVRGYESSAGYEGFNILLSNLEQNGIYVLSFDFQVTSGAWINDYQYVFGYRVQHNAYTSYPTYNKVSARQDLWKELPQDYVKHSHVLPFEAIGNSMHLTFAFPSFADSGRNYFEITNLKVSKLG